MKTPKLEEIMWGEDVFDNGYYLFKEEGEEWEPVEVCDGWIKRFGTPLRTNIQNKLGAYFIKIQMPNDPE